MTQEVVTHCAECDAPLDDKQRYVVGAHVYVCSKECYDIVLTETFGPLAVSPKD